MAKRTFSQTVSSINVSDEILTAIGCTVVVQADIEAQLGRTIHYLANMSSQKGYTVTSGMSFKMLCATLSSLVLQIWGKTDEHYVCFESQLGTLSHFEEFRNQIAHSEWWTVVGRVVGGKFQPVEQITTAHRRKTTARRGKGVKHHREELDVTEISREILQASIAIGTLMDLMDYIPSDALG
jgi:hypothetical protein